MSTWRNTCGADLHRCPAAMPVVDHSSNSSYVSEHPLQMNLEPPKNTGIVLRRKPRRQFSGIIRFHPFPNASQFSDLFFLFFDDG